MATPSQGGCSCGAVALLTQWPLLRNTASSLPLLRPTPAAAALPKRRSSYKRSSYKHRSFTLRSCRVSSAMRPLLGSASRSVSRASSCTGLTTAAEECRECAGVGGKTGSGSGGRWRQRHNQQRSQALPQRAPLTGARAAVVQAAGHLKPPRRRWPPACCSAA